MKNQGKSTEKNPAKKERKPGKREKEKRAFTEEQESELQKRARELAVEVKDTDKDLGSGSTDFLLFNLNRENYGIKLSSTSGIIESVRLIKIPYSPEYIAGVISLKGEIITVIDIRKILWLEQPSQKIRHMVCIVDLEDIQLGILVDKVFDIVKVHERSIQPSLSTLDKVKKEYVTGIVDIEGKVTILLDIQQALMTEIKELK